MSDYEIIKTALEIARSAHEGQNYATKEEWLSDYLDYVKIIKDSGNRLAIAVKKADLTMNMDLSRIPEPTAEDYERIEKKYKPALKIIESAEEGEMTV